MEERRAMMDAISCAWMVRSMPDRVSCIHIIDGSIIMVGKKPEEEPIDWTEYFKEVTAILANLAQTVVVVVLAVR